MKQLAGRVRRSALGRKKTCLTKLQARFKALRKKYRDLGQPEHHIWIMGCQRSGTTHLERIFRSDLDSAVFGEFSQLTLNPAVSVWQALPRVEIILSACNARYAVARPLFESDRVREILDYFPASTTIWLFRDCPHVVDSMMNKWNDRFFNISRKSETGEDGEWRLGGLCLEIEEELGQKATVQDKYALYWLKRNEIPFSNHLESDPRVMFLSYRQLVSDPEYCIDTIMKRCGLNQVWPRFRTDSHTRSIHKGVVNTITPDLLTRCDEHYVRLNELASRDFPEAKD